MLKNNIKVPFSPMPKELQVLMQRERGDCCYYYIETFNEIETFIETIYVVARRQECCYK